MGDAINSSVVSEIAVNKTLNKVASLDISGRENTSSSQPSLIERNSDHMQEQMEAQDQDLKHRSKQDDLTGNEAAKSSPQRTGIEHTTTNNGLGEADAKEKTIHPDKDSTGQSENNFPASEVSKIQAKESKPKNKSPKKRTFRIKHTIRVKVPDNVTVDLGEIMRSLRKRRLAQLRKIYPQMDLPEMGKAKEATDGETGIVKSSEEKTNNKPRSSKDKDTGNDFRLSNSVVSKDRFGSVLDYLEAKYVKGVMVAGERQKKRKRKSKDSSENEDESVMSSESEAGSCYSDGNSFIDDSELKSEVAQQVMTSSAYGTTRIEAEGGKGGDDKHLKGDDNAFFVNVGDLEMADGWESEQHWKMEDDVDSKKKKKKKTMKKRNHSQVEKSNTKIKRVDTSPKQQSSSKKRRRPEKPSPNKNSDTKKKIVKRRKNSGDTSTIVSSISKMKTNKKVKKPKRENKEKSEEDASGSGDDQSNVNNASDSSSSRDETKEDPKIQKMKQKSIQSYKTMRKHYKKVLNDIKNLTEEHLPRKPKKNKKVKVSIVVPQNKKAGDMITFSNPHVPGQKLKVKIPGKASAGGKFVVSVPMPEIRRSTDGQNNIPRDVRDRLDEYSQVYDDWCTDEAKYRDMLPKKKGKTLFRAAVERLKKFDELLKEFPNDLAHPIDASYLRKVVRRARQNSSKRRKLAMEKKPSTPTDGPKKKKRKKANHHANAPDPKIMLNVPVPGHIFPPISFNKADFAR